MAMLKRYKMRISHVEHPASSVYYRHAPSETQAILSWLVEHPSTKVDSIEAVPTHKDKVAKAPTKTRAYHKVRIKRIRNNVSNLIEDEEALLTPEERNQLAKAVSQLNRILFLWPTRSAELRKIK